MKTYKLNNQTVDSVELKCLLISRGVLVQNAVYKYAKNAETNSRLDINPLCCNCIILSDGTIAQLTDTQFHLRYLSGILSWDNIKLLRHVKDLHTPFSLRIQNGQPTLFYENNEVDIVSFPKASNFYKQKTALGRPFTGNAVMQGLNWVAFQCLWPCQFAADKKPCQFCFSGGDFENLAKKGKALPKPVPAADVREIVKYAFDNEGVENIQITGGSTYNGEVESSHIISYLNAISELAVPGELLLYATPPKDNITADKYFELGASRIACSLEVWDKEKAREITPGKYEFRDKYLDMLVYIAEKHGSGKAFSNFIIGIEEFDTLASGTTWLAERGIMPTASVWMPMGRPVQGSMKAPELDYYRRVKEHLANLYAKYTLEPTKSQGLNVCIERDVWEFAHSTPFGTT